MLCVWDQVEFHSAGEYAVGLLWHAADVVRSEDRGFVCRNEGTWDLPNGSTPDAHGDPCTFWIGMAGPAGTALGHERRALTDFNCPVTQKEHLFARWAGSAAPDQPCCFLSVIMPVRTDCRPDSVTMAIEAHAARIKLPGLECTFGADGECRVHTP